MANSLPFVIVNAFTSNLFGGNPAVTVFLKTELPTEMLQNIGKNFNQPIISFVYTLGHTGQDNKSATFGIRWFAGDLEPPLCGHGTLAATKAIFATPGLVSEDVEVINFETRLSGIVTARKVEGGMIEMELPSTTVTEVAPDVGEKVKAAVTKAFGKEVAIKYIGYGGKNFEMYLLIELDEGDNLGGSTIDTSALKATSPFIVNVITTPSSNQDAVFLSRMFAPAAGVNEDHVCGSAHCLLGPYWARKSGRGGDAMKAKQVSARGGDLEVRWEEDKGILHLKGQQKIVARGELYL